MSTPTLAGVAALQFDALMTLLSRVQSEGERERRAQGQNAAVQAATAAMQTAYPMIRTQDLAAIAQRRDAKSDLGRKWIVGKKGYSRGDLLDVVPAITAGWDFSTNDPFIRVTVALVATFEENGNRQLSATVFRFETGDVGTRHDFHHAQPTLAFEKQGPHFPGVRGPLNTSTPAFPLDAHGPVGVALCAVRSLWGAKDFGDMMKEQTMRQRVVPRLVEMPSFTLARKAVRPSTTPPLAPAAAPATVPAAAGAPPVATPKPAPPRSAPPTPAPPKPTPPKPGPPKPAPPTSGPAAPGR